MLTGPLSTKGGGIYEFVRGLSLALRDHQGIDVRVFGLADEASSADLPAWGGLPVRAAQVTGPSRFGYAGGLFKAVIDADLDLLHIHSTWMYPTLVSMRWADATRRPIIASPHGTLDPWALTNSLWKKRIAGLLYERRHLGRVACVHALAEAEVGAIRRFCPGGSICVVPNGVEMPVASELDATPPPWADRVPPGAKVLLFLGRIHPKKNIVSLVEAWDAATNGEERAGHWWLAIAGWDQLGYESKLRQIVTQQKIPCVLFLGPRFGPAKDACFRSASAFALPSLSEGLPTVVLEAWSHGLAALLTEQCNLPEGSAGGAAIAMASSPEGIRQGLRRLFELSSDDLEQMGQAGRRLVEERFTWRKVVKEMAAVYEWAVHGGQPPPSVLRSQPP